MCRLGSLLCLIVCPPLPQADTFQDDIFPPCPSGEPALTAEEWIGGTDADPKLKSFVEGVAVASTGPKVSLLSNGRSAGVSKAATSCSESS